MCGVHTLDGIPLTKVSTKDLQECLDYGIGINNGEETAENIESCLEQIRIIIYARSLGLL